MSIRTKASALHSSLLGIATASLMMLAACGGSGSSDGSGSRAPVRCRRPNADARAFAHDRHGCDPAD